MKRFHVHVSVQDLESAMKFYSNLFGTAPTVQQPDYAKWMLEDPAGIAWEGFHTLASIPTFSRQQSAPSNSSCCVPGGVPVSALKKRPKASGSQCC
jgi:catechol-2,3-dioxygenase